MSDTATFYWAGYTKRMPALRLEIFSRDALLTLCHCALAGPEAGAAGQPDGPELLRRIELAQARLTEALKQASEARALSGILDEKLAEARRSLQTAQADLDIHDRDNPPLPRRRLLGPRLTPQQAVQQQQREALTARVKAAQEALARLQGEQERVKTSHDAAQELRRLAEAERSGYTGALQSRLSHEVLCALMPGGAGQAVALDRLEQARRTVRGDPQVGILSVLAALFSGGTRSEGAHRARDMLSNLRILFEQHPGPYERVLLVFIALVASAGAQRPGLADIGIYPGAGPADDGLFRLYLLTRVLGGLNFEPPGDRMRDGFALVLELVAAQIGGGPLPAAGGHDTARAAPSLLDAVLTCNLLLNTERQVEIPAAAGVDLAGIPAHRSGRGKYPALLSLCEKLPAPAWPAETVALWRSLLALHLLCAARGLPLGAAYAQWLEESYGWPKSAFYWHMLAFLKDDPSLLRNMPAAGWPAL